MNLKEWAASQGVSYSSARRWYEAGVLPVLSYRMGRLILVDRGSATTAPPVRTDTAIYARVSSADQHADLDRQVARIAQWASDQGICVDKVVTEVGSALNGHRRRFTTLLADPCEVDDDLVGDVPEALTSLCARLYGRRSAADRAHRAVKVATRAAAPPDHVPPAIADEPTTPAAGTR